MQAKRHLLSKEHYQLLLEAAVDWNKSAAGKTTSGLGSLMSWITGKIKKGLNNRKLNTLVLMWGTEYVKALEALEKNLDVKQELEENGQDTEDTTEDTIDSADEEIADYTVEQFNTDLVTVKKFAEEIPKAKVIINEMDKWAIPTNDTGFNDIKTKLTPISNFALSDDSGTVTDFIRIDAFINTFNNNIKLVHPFVQAIVHKKTANEFCNHIKIKDIAGLKAEVKKVSDCLDSMYSLYTKALKSADTLTKVIKFNTELKALKDAELTKHVEEIKKSNADMIEDISKDIAVEKNILFKTEYTAFLDFVNPKKDETSEDGTETDKKSEPTDTKTQPVKPDAAKPADTTTTAKPVDAAKPGQPVKPVPPVTATNASYKSINEKNIERQLPTTIENLLSKEDLVILSQQTDILTKSFPKVNLYRLTGLAYEANYIIVNAKKSKDADKIFNKEEDGDADLKKTWDLGINNVNDYFQKVIDTKKIMSSIKIDTLKSDDKKKIETTEKTIDIARYMGFDEAMDPKNAKFNPKNIYSFNISINGTTARSDKFIITSPTANYIEKIDDQTYYWHKVFGEYDYDMKTQKTDRKNLFDGITKNQKMVEYFSKPGETYYLVLTKQSVSSTFSPAFFYSSKGNIFYNNKIQRLEDIKNEITSNFENIKDTEKFKEWKVIGNGFGIKINSRYSIDSNDIDKYPGIKKNDVTKDDNLDVAKKNHAELMKLLNLKTK